MAGATRQDVVDAFDAALKQYQKVKDLDGKFDLVAGELMKIGNRGYQLQRKERLETTTPVPAKADEPEEEKQGDGLTEMTVDQLRKMAASNGIKVTSRSTKKDLIAKLATL